MNNCNHLIQKGNRVYGGSSNGSKKFGSYVMTSVSVDTDANEYQKTSSGKKVIVKSHKKDAMKGVNFKSNHKK